MMGSPGAPFGEQQVNGMGQQPMPAPRPMPMPNYRGYGFNPQPGGMPQPNPGYGQMPAPAPRPMPYPVDFSRLLGGGMSQYPGFGGAVQPGGVDFLRGQFGGAVQPGGIDYLRGQFGGAPSPDGGPSVPGNERGYLFNNEYPRPDGGRVDNPDLQQNPFRTFNNGNPFYNAKGNLRMKWRDGFGAAGQDPSQSMNRHGQYDFANLKRLNDQMAWDMQNYGQILARPT
jgi:hypothetical protein